MCVCVCVCLFVCLFGNVDRSLLTILDPGLKCPQGPFSTQESDWGLLFIACLYVCPYVHCNVRMSACLYQAKSMVRFRMEIN